MTAAAGGRTALDLFAGTGNATAALRRRGWRVITVDSDPARSPDVLADVRALPFRPSDVELDFLWASPPCTEFSDANPRVDHAGKRPSLDLVAAVLRTVAEFRPRFWIMENVRGAIPFLGIPVQKIGPFCLWGYFPEVVPSWDARSYHKWAAGRSAAAWAAVPPALSEAVASALDSSMELPSILDLRPTRRHRHRRRAAGALRGQLDAFRAET